MTMHDIVHRLSSVLKIVLGQEETMISRYFLLVGSNTLQTLPPPSLKKGLVQSEITFRPCS